MWAARGGRSYDAAIKNKYRQYVRRALEFNYQSVEDRFRRVATLREQMTRSARRSETIS